jgi:hypothetical protein
MNFTRASAFLIDGAMCALMFAIQRRHRLNGASHAALESYIAAHEPLTRNEYFHAPAADHPAPGTRHSPLAWPSPILTGFPANDRVHVDLFPCPAGWSAPTVLFLHALMSASDRGYRAGPPSSMRAGWNACFVHLPYHYSRTPRGHWNGELSITADLVRTAEGLRQGVAELRQLMAALRGWGCREVGLWASSYGGWIGALLASVERDFRFVALLEPIVDVEHAIWVSPAGAALRGELRRTGIEHALIARHFRLASPLHGEPLCGADHVLFCAGEYDRVTRPTEISRLHERLAGSQLLRVPQVHFGFQMSAPRGASGRARNPLIRLGATSQPVLSNQCRAPMSSPIPIPLRERKLDLTAAMSHPPSRACAHTTDSPGPRRARWFASVPLLRSAGNRSRCRSAENHARPGHERNER